MGFDPVTAFVVQLVVTTAISWVLKPDPPKRNVQQQETAQGILVNKASNNSAIPVVYGKRQVGIARVFVESSGSNNQYLYMAGVLCEGGGNGIESVDEIYVNDKLVVWSGALTDGTVRTVNSSDTNFYKDGSLISVQAFYGLDNQSVSSILDESTNWGSNHKLSGVAYLAFKFTWNQDAFSSLPEVKVVLKGKKIYDPRLDSTKGGSGSHRQDTASTWTYSPNSALCLLDYLRNTRYGKGLPNSSFETNYDSFKTSANICETQVTPYTSAPSDIDLFETNLVIDTEQKVIDNVRELLNPMRAIFTYTQGKYFLIIENTGTSQLSLNADNIIGGIKIFGEKKNTKYNRVIGTFVNPDKEWQEDTITFPPADDSGLPVGDRYATLLAEDNGTQLEGNFTFQGITNPYQAEELCEIILRRSRNALAVEVMVTSEALNLTIGDIVDLTYSTGGFSAKPFRVYGLSINTDSTVSLKLIEHQDNFYTWTSKAEAPTISDTTLPNPFSVAPPSAITLSDDLIEYNDGTCITRLKVDITASPDAFVDQYEVEVKQTFDRKGIAVSDDFRVIGRGIALSYDLLNAIDGATYQVRARAINTLGVRSTFVTANRLVIGATATPSNVSSFAISLVGSNQMELSWTPVSDLDIEFYEIRYQKVASGAVWNNSTNLVQVPRRKSNSKTINILEPPFALMIKAVDKLGNESAEPATIFSNVSRLENFESIGVITE
jgi:hypothetical protein